MKNIRIWFQKTDTARYISHLDLMRAMARAIRKAHLPFWYTEGFNPHVFLTINMPLSLGYSGLRESMDVKLLQDDYPFKEIVSKMNEGLPEDVHVFEISEIIMKPSKIAFAKYSVSIDCEDSEKLKESFQNFLSLPELLTEKNTKKGITTIDIKPEFMNTEFDSSDSKKLSMSMLLKSSNSGGINPRLLLELYSKTNNVDLFPYVTRVDCYDENMQEFA